MNQQESEFKVFYDDQTLASQPSHRGTHAPGLWNLTSVGLSILALVITTLCKFYGWDGRLEHLLASVLALICDCLALATPASLVFALDDWLTPQSPPERPMLGPRQSTHAAKSQAMRRIIRLGHAGHMMESVFRARTRALSLTGSVLGLKSDLERPPGLGNCDNSCYQNSVLQGLASLDSLAQYLAHCRPDLDPEAEGKDVAQALATLIRDLNDGSNSGKTLWSPSPLRSMSTWTQQDAQEYYSKMLDDIDKSIAEAAKGKRHHPGFEADYTRDETAASQHSDDSGYRSQSPGPALAAPGSMRNPLEGLLAQRVACLQCGYSEGLSMIPFNCLTLSLGLDKSRHDLYERLDSYAKVETIDGVECPKCTLLKSQRLLSKLVSRMRELSSTAEQVAEPLRRLEAVETALEEDDFDDETVSSVCKIPARAKVSSTKTKQIVVARPPQSLVIHINRSVFDPSTLEMIKNTAPVRFPLTLDLGPWCLGSSAAGAGFKAESDSEEQPVSTAGEELWQAEPMASMIAGDSTPSRLTGPIYELRAVVTHSGRHENGHYICYRKFPGPGPDEGPTQAEAEAGMGSNEDVANGHDAETGGGGGGSSSSSIDGGGEEGGGRATEGETETSTGVQAQAMAGWWRLSDHNVNKVDEETVMALSPGIFMLFYECLDADMVLSDEPPPTEPGGQADERESSQGSGEGENKAKEEEAASEDEEQGVDDVSAASEAGGGGGGWAHGGGLDEEATLHEHDGEGTNEEVNGQRGDGEGG